MAPHSPPHELWDVDRFAELLGKTPRFIYRLTSQNRVRYIQLGRDLRFDPADISDYLERRKAGLDKAAPKTPARRTGRPRATDGRAA